MNNKKLDEIHTDYNNIPIPKDLKQKIEASMQKAKEENAMNKPKNTIIKVMRRTVGGAAAAMLVITVLTNSNSAIAHAMGQIPVIGMISEGLTFRTYEKKDGDMTAKVDVPQVSLNGNESGALDEATNQLNKSVEEYTNEIIAMFEQDIEATGGEGREDLNTTYKVITDSDTLFSLRIDTSVVMAGSNSFSKIYHIDKTTGKTIELKDLFKEDADYVSTLSGVIIEQMREQIKADENIKYFIDTEIGDLDFKSIEADENFYINENGKLVLVFDKYEIAPGYMGMVEMEIPTEAIQDIINDGFVK